jgi:hypothetical protein
MHEVLVAQQFATVNDLDILHDSLPASDRVKDVDCAVR